MKKFRIPVKFFGNNFDNILFLINELISTKILLKFYLNHDWKGEFLDLIYTNFVISCQAVFVKFKVKNHENINDPLSKLKLKNSLL